MTLTIFGMVDVLVNIPKPKIQISHKVANCERTKLELLLSLKTSFGVIHSFVDKINLPEL